MVGISVIRELHIDNCDYCTYQREIFCKIMPSTSRRVQYDAKFKRQVILVAEKYGNRDAGRRFSVSEANVRRWRSQRGALFKCRSSLKGFRGPKEGRYPEMEKVVADFVRESRANGLPVTRRMIYCKAKEESTTRGIGNFKASEGWCRKFMRRHGFALRRRTSVCQKLPVHFEDKLLEFQRYIINLRKNRTYTFNNIGNADETPIYFDMPRACVVNEKGAKEVKVLTTGYEKQRVTVMLAILADGKKLPPYIILKRKTIPKKEVFPKDVIVRAQVKGWMTTELMEDWLDKVWNRRPGSLRTPPSFLVLDAFKGHTADAVKRKMMNMNTNLVLIPGGMTSQIQPLDVSVNKPFKDHVRDEYEKWLFTDNLPLTNTGKIKKAPASEVARWISVAWAKVSEDVVAKSFKKCFISNALDGSEDNIVWEEADIDEPMHEDSSSTDDSFSTDDSCSDDDS